jgi:anti-sigma regulatory factor (Ser/Thr protein kinase)/anti-anti-sigma regulatory factor
MFNVSYNLDDIHSDVIFVNLSGTFDENSVDSVRDEFEKVFENDRPFVIVNVLNVDEICGAAVGEIMEWRKKISANLSGDFCFCDASPSLEKEMKQIVGDGVIRFFADSATAINYLSWEYKGHVETVILTIPSSLKVVPMARKLVSQTVALKGYSRRESFQIETIIDELCNNAVEHGSGEESEEGIEIAVAIGREKVEINISNSTGYKQGVTRKSKEVVQMMEKFVSSPNNTIDESRGRGLALVKMLSNEFEIDSSEYGTCVHVTKYREAL